MSPLLFFLLLLLVYSAVSRRLERTVLTAPILFTLAGILLGFTPSPDHDPHRAMSAFLTAAEIGLVLTLFTDACRTDLRILKSIRNLPTRLLSTGMLLTIVLGMAAALLLFPGFTVWDAGALAAILAPTDAGLGLVIVNSPKVPLKIRQALNVEAGLNDGLSVPFLMFFIAVALTGTEGSGAVLGRFVIEQLGFGAVLGIALGLTGGWLLALGQRRQWMAGTFNRVGMVTMPLLCAVGSEPFGASMFIAAFVCGLAVQTRYKEAGKHSVELAEEWGQLLNLAVFFLFGLLVSRAWPQFTLAHFAYGLLSLTLIRMLPVGLALRGTGLSRATVLFMGWFGPRGLASIVLGLIYLEQEVHSAGGAQIQLIVMATVLLSVLLHGITAGPGIQLYARSIGDRDGPEREG